LTVQDIPKFIYFGLWGLPGFFLSLLLNYTFIEYFNINVYESFIYVLLIITLLNFFIVDKIVFKSKNKKIEPTQRFFLFVSITLTSRALEWSSYSAAIYLFGFHYLLVQIAVSLTFVLLKFVVLKRVMN